jgi:hypothetical protein
MAAGFAEVIEREETLVAEAGFEPTSPPRAGARAEKSDAAFSW